MKLKQLVNNLNVVEVVGNLDCEINEIKTDSNAVTKGNLFVCLNGVSYDGHNFIKQVENYGAAACVTERKINTILPQIVVKDCRVAVSILSSIINNSADKKLKITGVVGTNGKTTTTYFLTSILMNAGINCGLIGTLGTFYNGVREESFLTTPDAPILHKSFSEMVNCNTENVVMEVSAHAIALKKIEGITFEQGVFTNFSQDHLDFFGDMANYRKTKLSFFDERCKSVIVNSDDELGREILKKRPFAISYGIENPADVFAINIKEKQGYTTFVINLFDEIFNVKLNMIGKFNVLNALAAATTASVSGISPYKVVEGLENLKGVDGRLENIFNENFSIYLDYAHTPDGLSNSLKALKPQCKGKLICVFGCGGNRDAAKRSVMGKISGELADFSVLTSDNPRFEEPMEIIWQIEKGLLSVSKKYVIVQDRTDAIRYALDFARDGDIVLIAGKGGEKYQEICGIKHPFNDKEIVREYLKKKW